MNSIRIVSVPPGEAPAWVREAWVGLVITLPRKALSDKTQRGLSSTEVEKFDNYEVDVWPALDKLREKSVIAAGWYDGNLPRGTNQLTFPQSVCEPVS